MVYRIFSIKDITDEITKKYFPMLTEARREKLLSMKDGVFAAKLFLAEILARQTLSELCDAPEFAFDLLIHPDSKCIVSNFNAFISVATSGDYVACCASRSSVGISINAPVGFSFADAQKLLSDAEIRNLYSYSKYSLTEILNQSECDEKVVCEKFSQYQSLKNACFLSSGRGIRSAVSKISFDMTQESIICSDSNYQVVYSEFLSDKNLACSIIEKI